MEPNQDLGSGSRAPRSVLSATVVICLRVMKAAEGRVWPLVARVALVMWTSARTLGLLSCV